MTSISTDAFDFKDNGLGKLVELLEENSKKAYVRVGILGGKSSRDGSKTNAEIGAHHEFGTENLPVRSFLRMPIALHLDDELKKSKMYDEKTLTKMIEDESLEDLLKKIGVAAEAVIADAFSTGGFGQWKKSDMGKKKVHSTLIETQQLRNSITSEVTSD